MNRYDGKPLLRLLECYVLDSIGELDSEMRSTLVKMEPKLSETFESKRGWDSILECALKLPANTRSQIKEFWVGYSEAAIKQGLPVDPDVFSIQFVDQNFNLQ